MPALSRSRSPLRAVAVVAVTLCVGSVWLSAQAGSSQAQARTDRRGDRVMYVSAVDSQGVPVKDLKAEEFVVREDGVRREVVSIEKATEPVTIALLVDNSAATSDYVNDMRMALKSFVKQLAGKNPMSVVTFGERPTVQTDFTLTSATVEKAAERVFSLPGSGAYLLQAIDDTCKSLAKRDFDRGLVLAITAPGPEFSERHYRELLTPLRESGARLTVLAFTPAGSGDFDMRNDGVRERALLLDGGPRVTGGTRVDLLTSMALDGALTKIADQLANEYKVTYVRPERLIPPEKVELSVSRTGVEAHATQVKAKRN
jgi:VWFA-related protein